MNVLLSIQPALSALKIAALQVVISSLFASCAKSSAIDEHPEFVNMLSQHMDTAQNKNLDQTFLFIDSSLKALKNPGIGDVFIADSIMQAKYSFVQHDYNRALSLLDSMMVLVKGRTAEEIYAERYATVLYEKGQCFMYMKRYNESLYYIRLAEKAVLTMVQNKCNMLRLSCKSAYLMFAQEKYQQAAALFLAQYKQYIAGCSHEYQKADPEEEGYLNNVAVSYLKARMLDSASWYLAKTLNTIVSHQVWYPTNEKYNYAKSVVYGDQAEVLALKGYYAEAEDLYNKSINGTSIPDVGYTQSTQARLADAYLKDNKIDSAYLELNFLKESLDTFYNEKQLISWHKLSAQYYTQAKQAGKAFRHQQQYEVIRDSIEARDKKFLAVDIAKEFENLELTYANEVLQKEGKLKSLYLIIAIITFIAAAAITCFIWYNLKRTRKLHREVAQKNDELQKALSSLEQSHTENNRIIRIVAHDLKNPVSAINNLIFSLLKKEYPADLKEIFGVIKTACSNSMVLINDVLNQKKNKAAIRTELVDMKRLLEYCVNLLQSKAVEKNQHLTLQAEDVLVMLNRQKMWRVISNIINNAIKFSPENTSIDIKLQRKPDSVVLSVHDNGIGIPENLKDKIFSMAPEVSRPGTFGEESYGLGLTISQKIIEEHKGKIWFDSNSKGSVFYVELPCLN